MYVNQIVNFIDSDCEADSHWVEAMVEAHYHELKNEPGRFGEAILSGLTYAYGSSNVGKFHDHFGTLNGRIKKNGGGLLYGPSCNFSIRISKKLIYEVGGFDESFPKAAFEDVEARLGLAFLLLALTGTATGASVLQTICLCIILHIASYCHHIKTNVRCKV